MRTWIKRISQTVLAAFVAVSLGIGVTQLQATSATLDHCHPDQIGGHCASDEECDETCEQLGFPDGSCTPDQGCCFCLE